MTITCMQALQRKGVYYHFLPTLVTARRDVWDNIVRDTYGGIEHTYRLIDAVFPVEIRAKRPNETEMQIELINGSIWQCMGAEDLEAVNRARGANPFGIVCSEYAFMPVDPWAVLSPILLENQGWIAFISTPNIEDDKFHKLYKNALTDPQWLAQLLTIEDTRRDAEGEDGSPVITQEDIAQLRKENHTEEEIQREYYCSFKGYMRGTIYGDIIESAESARRIGNFPWIPQLPVGVCFDIGHSDAMVMWFYQIQNGNIYFIDYWEGRLKDIKDAAHVLREERPYLYGKIILPWDGHSAQNYLEEVGFKNIVVCQRNKMEETGDATMSVQEQIQTVRLAFNRFYFDNTVRDQQNGAGVGLDHLKRYARKWNEEKSSFEKEPSHNQHSHAADALRTGVAGGFAPLTFPFDQTQNREVKVDSNFDPRRM